MRRLVCATLLLADISGYTGFMTGGGRILELVQPDLAPRPT